MHYGVWAALSVHLNFTVAKERTDWWWLSALLRFGCVTAESEQPKIGRNLKL